MHCRLDKCIDKSSKDPTVKIVNHFQDKRFYDWDGADNRRKKRDMNIDQRQFWNRYTQKHNTLISKNLH